MRKYRFSSKAPDPRVLCVSNRDIAPVISRCLRYEFEDLIAAMDAVDVIAPADTPDPEDADTPVQNGIRTLRRLAAKTLRRLTVKLEGMLPITGLRRLPAGLSRNYELLFVSTESARRPVQPRVHARCGARRPASRCATSRNSMPRTCLGWAAF